MMKNNEYHQFNESELIVLAFLKNLKQYSSENFNYLGFYGASAREMITFLEHPEKYGNYDFGFVCSLFDAIHKTYKNYIIKPALIPAQNKEDKILSSVLMTSDSVFESILVHERLIDKSHLNAYLLRDEVIYKWNGWLLLVVQKTVEKLKVEMRLKLQIIV